jgi:hypothetical protein
MIDAGDGADLVMFFAGLCAAFFCGVILMAWGIPPTSD